MARPPTQTIEKARAAFIELIQNKQRPTAAKIRQMIGGGGTDLIQRVIREMEDELYMRMFELANRPEAPREVVDLVMQLWDRANSRADERFAEERQHLQTQLDQVIAHRGELLDQAQSLENERSALTDQVAEQSAAIEALRTRLATAEGRCSQLQDIVATRTNDLERAEARTKEIDRRAAEQIAAAEERYKGLETRLMENVERERAQHQGTIKAMKTDQAAAVEQRDQALKRNRELEARLEKMSAELTGLAATKSVELDKLQKKLLALADGKKARASTGARAARKPPVKAGKAKSLRVKPKAAKAR